jgi:hypothetical protein
MISDLNSRIWMITLFNYLQPCSLNVGNFKSESVQRECLFQQLLVSSDADTAIDFYFVDHQEKNISSHPYFIVRLLDLTIPALFIISPHLSPPSEKFIIFFGQ